MDNTKKLKHLSLCTGYGGIDLGLSRTIKDVRTVCYVEIEAYAVQNLVAKIEAGLLDAAPIFTDLKQFPWHIFSGKVDILSGGFPCQPFSGAGQKQADSDPRHLWPYIKQGIRELNRPPFIFLENVEGIISAKLKGDEWADPADTSVLHHVLRELERLGYKAEAGLFSASEVGAPQNRKRVFILGIRNDLGPSGYKLIRERIKTEGNKTAWPAYRGQKQYEFEPARVTEIADKKTKSQMGRNVNGVADRVDFTELCKSYGNRTDELRILGNGVMPNTASKAFKTLWSRLDVAYSTCKPKG